MPLTKKQNCNYYALLDTLCWENNNPDTYYVPMTKYEYADLNGSRLLNYINEVPDHHDGNPYTMMKYIVGVDLGYCKDEFDAMDKFKKLRPELEKKYLKTPPKFGYGYNFSKKTTRYFSLRKNFADKNVNLANKLISKLRNNPNDKLKVIDYAYHDGRIFLYKDSTSKVTPQDMHSNYYYGSIINFYIGDFDNLIIDGESVGNFKNADYAIDNYLIPAIKKELHITNNFSKFRFGKISDNSNLDPDFIVVDFWFSMKYSDLMNETAVYRVMKELCDTINKETYYACSFDKSPGGYFSHTACSMRMNNNGRDEPKSSEFINERIKLHLKRLAKDYIVSYDFKGHSSKGPENIEVSHYYETVNND